jgi:hypothetical protein
MKMAASAAVLRLSRRRRERKTPDSGSNNRGTRNTPK